MKPRVATQKVHVNTVQCNICEWPILIKILALLYVLGRQGEGDLFLNWLLP